MRRAVVCGAGGFIGGHLALRLKAEGYWVRGVDVKQPEYRNLDVDEFVISDLRSADGCRRALDGPQIDEVYQLAADMGGMEFIHSAECDVLHNNVLVNTHMIDTAVKLGVSRYFYSSSVCVYRDMTIGEPEIAEAGAYPAIPDNEYGWEKLYSERVVSAYGRRYGIETRIGRFQNCYGPYGTWDGGREKAPAAISRKVAMAPDGGVIEAFGDGTAIRSFVYVDDLVSAVRTLMDSDLKEPANIGTREYVCVAELIQMVAKVAQKNIEVKWIAGPVGVQSRNFGNDLIESLGFRPEYSLIDGLEATYYWIADQVEAKQK